MWSKNTILKILPFLLVYVHHAVLETITKRASWKYSFARGGRVEFATLICVMLLSYVTASYVGMLWY